MLSVNTHMEASVNINIPRLSEIGVAQRGVTDKTASDGKQPKLARLPKTIDKLVTGRLSIDPDTYSSVDPVLGRCVVPLWVNDLVIVVGAENERFQVVCLQVSLTSPHLTLSHNKHTLTQLHIHQHSQNNNYYYTQLTAYFPGQPG